MEHAIQEEIFTELYSKYYKTLVSFAYSWVNRWEDAEDIVSNLFLKVPPKMNDDQKGTLKVAIAFFFVCTRNACFSYIEHSSRRVVYDTDAVEDKLQNKPDVQIDDEDKEAVSAFFKMEELLHSLPSKSVYILRQIYLNNATTAELAEQMNLATQTILNMKSNAINNIKKVLNGTYHVVKTDKTTTMRKIWIPKKKEL